MIQRLPVNSHAPETFITSFASKAFRRPVDADQTQILQSIWQVGRTTGGSFNSGVQAVITAVLQMPEFLYRFEMSPAVAGQTLVPLDGWDMATRLSYLLWNSGPDDMLLAAAQAGQLQTAADISAQVTRMLSQPRAQEMVMRFHDQWLQVTAIGTLEKDPMLYPKFTPAVATAMQQEVRSLVNDVVLQGDGKVAELFTAPYTFMNDTLGKFYGVNGLTPTFTRVDQSALGMRPAAGILTMGGLLASYASGDYTSPTKRGKFVRGALLCQLLPPPPPNANPIPPVAQPNQTRRQAMANHATDPTCGACHQLMDQVGFGFEGFDSVGELQTTDNGQPIDSSGTIVGTDVAGPFNGPVELGAKLAGSDDVLKCTATQWFRFAFGRGSGATDGDTCAVSQLHDALKQGGVLALVKAVPSTAAFLIPQGSRRRDVMFKRISRRAVIRGAGGLAIGLPFLEAMRPSRAWAADAANPKRLITWYTANGQMPAYWYPTGTETNFTLNAAHQPLLPYQSKLILFNGVKDDAGNDPAYGGHQGSFCSMLSGSPFVNPQSFNTMRPSTPSLDQLVADKIGGTTPVALLPTGVVPAGSGNGNALQAIGSWRGPTQLIPPISQPSALFDYLFMNGKSAGMPQNTMAADNLRTLRKSILDSVADRFKTLEARVGTEDKARLDQHMTSIRSIETQLLAVQPMAAACTVPTRPADNFDMGNSNIPAWGKLNLDMMVLALACDLTRVANFFWFAMGSGGVTFSWLGHTNTHHNLAHASALKEMTQINHLVQHAARVRHEPSLDTARTDVSGGSRCWTTRSSFGGTAPGNGSSHVSSPAPYLIAGGAGGDLKMGRYLDYTAAKVQAPQILLSVYNVLTGSQDTVFGSPKYCPGPAPGL